VNLYIPSTVRWTRDGARVSVTQKSEYPLETTVKFEITASTTTNFALHLRIPVWADGASISVNGKSVPASGAVGKFATIRRPWKPATASNWTCHEMRLEPIDVKHPQTVALLCGPWYCSQSRCPSSVTARQYWQQEESATHYGKLKTAAAPHHDAVHRITDQQYSTYLTVRLK